MALREPVLVGIYGYFPKYIGVAAAGVLGDRHEIRIGTDIQRGLGKIQYLAEVHIKDFWLRKFGQPSFSFTMGMVWCMCFCE